MAKKSRPSLSYEKEARLKGYSRVAGVDEAGRGPLAGPVVAAVCCLNQEVHFPEVNDSKQLTQEAREDLFHKITSHPSVSWGVGIVDSAIIDKVNIYQATLLAMQQAIEKLIVPPECLLVDGLALPYPTIPVTKIIRGDALSHVIACASVIAKVTRDDLMRKYDQQYPEWGFAQHKGYGTPAHLAAIAHHGLSPLHRRSFAPCKPCHCSQVPYL